MVNNGSVDRDEQIRLAGAAVRRSNSELYGIDAADEAYLGTLPDKVLEQIIAANPVRPGPFVG